MKSPSKSPRDIYAEIRAATPADLDRRVLAVMLHHRGSDNRISRRDLVEQVFGVSLAADDDLSTLTIDRQLRSSIARLQEDYPIVSSSGDGGYCLIGSLAELEIYEREITSRAAALLDKSRRLRRSAELYLAREQTPPAQMRLL